MALFDLGRVCRKTAGKDAGEFCVITEKVEGGFIVEGKKVKKGKVSGSHLEPTNLIVSAKDAVAELEKNNLA